MDVVCKIEALFTRRGAAHYPAEGVTALAHALQCAQLAEWAYAESALVAAALLHDLGQLLDAAADEDLHDDEHELRALGLLTAGGFGSAVLEPIRLHVLAERCLNGRMNAVERLIFLARPFASQALQLARWDALAQHPGKRVPPLAYYLNLLDDVLRAKSQARRVMLA
ncbi:HD domain-containing protein [soil metagenome]